MKIKIIKQRLHNGSCSYKYLPFNYCCGQLLDNPSIEFTDEWIGKPQISLRTEGEYGYTRYDSISFCPFCGEPIEIDVIAIEDKAEVCKKLDEQLKDIKNKIRMTDSKKEEKELKEQLFKVDRELEYLYEFDEYKTEYVKSGNKS